MHQSCFKKYTKIHKNGTLLCKVCKQDWPREINSDEFIAIGERAVRKNEQEQRIQLGGASGGEDEDEDQEYPEEDQDLEIDSQSQSQSPNVKVQNNSKRTRPEIVKNGLDEDTSAQRPRPRRNMRRG